MLHDGRPIVEAAGRLGNQYIWLAYALSIGAGKITTNQQDLININCGIEVELRDKVPFDGKSWIKACRHKNITPEIPRLRELLIPEHSGSIKAIALHVRMGDKMGLKEYMKPSRGFYQQALEMMPLELPVNVFSDDILGAQKIVGGLRDVIGYVHSSPKQDFISIYRHTHHIIPDTTFSWMASLMSPFREQAIMQDNPMFKNLFKFPGLQRI